MRLLEKIKDQDDWLLLRLFYAPESSWVIFLCDNALVVAFGMVLVAVALPALVSFTQLLLQHKPSKKLSNFLLAYCVVICIGVPVLIGRENIFPRQPGLRTESNCCNPAIVYPNSNIPKITDVIHKHADGSVASDEHVYKSPELKYYTQYSAWPNLFQHFGYNSSRDNWDKKRTFKVSHSFEFDSFIKK